MKKDYIPVSDSESVLPEASFIEAFWSKKWDQRELNGFLAERIEKREEYRLMQSYLEKLPVGCRMLDGGCGLGDWTLYLAEKGYQVTGIDLSRSTIQVTPIHKWQGLRRMIQHDLHLDPKSKIGKAAHVLLYPFIPKSYESSRFHKGGNHDGYHPRSGLLHQNA